MADAFDDLANAAWRAGESFDDQTKGEAAWPEPDMSMIEERTEPAPAFPVDLFGPFWASWLKAAAEGKGAPVDYVGQSLLCATGSILANARRASPWPQWTEAPILWNVNVGNPSSNKSPGQDAVLEHPVGNSKSKIA